MSPRSPEKHASVLGGAWTILFGLVLICCVMVMHGLQASNSPADASGMPKVTAEPLTSHGESSHGGSGHGKQNDGSHDHERHAGGEICLALLTLAALAVLMRVTWRAWTPTILSPWSTERPRPSDAGRSPPPPAFRSAVLRL
jgi:hypothetical protein